ncbi:MAG: phasin family protein [Herminiimonas sp.]|nr:phasin family protein [Herminiimonas sp.]
MAQVNPTSPISDLVNNQLEISRQCADAVFAGTERIDRVMRGATHRVMADQFQLAKALATMSDPRGFIELQSGMLNRPDNVAHYAQEVMQAVGEMQSDISHSMQRYVEQLREQANAQALLRARGTTQAETPEPRQFNPLSGMFSMWQAAMKEVAAMANQNLQTARSGMEAAAERSEAPAGGTIDDTNHQPSWAEPNATAHKGAGSGKRK